MSVTVSLQQRLLVSGRPMSAPLRNVRRTAENMVAHFVEHVAPCATLPGEFVRGEITAVTVHCLEAVIGILDGESPPGDIPRLTQAAAEWAREGVPLDTILHAVHAGFRLLLDQLGGPGIGSPAGAARAGDLDDFGLGVKVILDMLDTVTSTTTAAYLQEMEWVAAEQHSASSTLTSALLSGHATATMADECGVGLAARYHVFAIHIPSPPQEPGDGRTPPARTPRRMRAELATRTANEALPLLSAVGGTVLVPTGVVADDELDELVAALGRAARAGLTAVVVTVDRAAIAEVSEHAHQLLDVITRLSYAPGLYRFENMAREVQLTRPGPARDRLAAVLDPLSGHPELMLLLHSHLSNDLNRRLTAEQFDIHPNTVDHRLKRVSALTGVDPASGAGAFVLQSALIARGYAPPPGRQPAPRTPRLRGTSGTPTTLTGRCPS